MQNAFRFLFFKWKHLEFMKQLCTTQVLDTMMLVWIAVVGILMPFKLLTGLHNMMSNLLLS